MGVLAYHVDNSIWGGSEKFSMTVLPRLKAAFQIGREEHNSFNYTGMEVLSVEDEIQVQQWMCIKNLRPIPVDPTSTTQREAP